MLLSLRSRKQRGGSGNSGQNDASSSSVVAVPKPSPDSLSDHDTTPAQHDSAQRPHGAEAGPSSLPAPTSPTSSPTSSSSSTTSTFTCNECPHHTAATHFRSRCGCPNKRAQEDPMHNADDGFHRMWCVECMKFCATEAGCEMKFEKIYGGDGKLYEVLLAKVKGTVWDLLDLLLRGVKSWKVKLPTFRHHRRASSTLV